METLLISGEIIRILISVNIDLHAVFRQIKQKQQLINELHLIVNLPSLDWFLNAILLGWADPIQYIHECVYNSLARSNVYELKKVGIYPHDYSALSVAPTYALNLNIINLLD